MAITISMVLFDTLPELDQAALETYLSSKWTNLGITEVKKEGGTITFSLGAAEVILGMMPKSVPWVDLQGPCSTSLLWPNSAETVKNHQGHVIVAVSSKLTPLSTSKLLTQFTASVLAVSPQATGVLWNNAVHLIQKSIFLDFAEKVLPDGPPLEIWVDFRVGLNQDGTSVGFTSGLAALGHMEIEAVSSPEPPVALRERLQALAHYLLDKGPVIKDGNTIGADEREMIKAVYSPSQFGHKTQVMRLEYQKQSPDQPWGQA